MFKHNISRTIYVDVAQAPVAAGTGDTQNGLTIDTEGYESIVFLLYVGTIVAGGSATLKLQYGNASNLSDATDITGGSVAIPQTGQNQGWLSVEVHRPTKRYMRIAVVRTTANVTLNGAIVMMGRIYQSPPVQGTMMGNVNPTVLVSP